MTRRGPSLASLLQLESFWCYGHLLLQQSWFIWGSSDGRPWYMLLHIWFAWAFGSCFSELICSGSLHGLPINLPKRTTCRSVRKLTVPVTLNHEMSFYIFNYCASLRCTTRSVKKERITIWETLHMHLVPSDFSQFWLWLWRSRLRIPMQRLR